MSVRITKVEQEQERKEYFRRLQYCRKLPKHLQKNYRDSYIAVFKKSRLFPKDESVHADNSIQFFRSKTLDFSNIKSNGQSVKNIKNVYIKSLKISPRDAKLNKKK